MGPHLARPLRTWSSESGPLARDKIQEICGSGHGDDPDTDRLGQGIDKSLGHRRLLAFLGGPPEEWLLGVPPPRDRE